MISFGGFVDLIILFFSVGLVGFGGFVGIGSVWEWDWDCSRCFILVICVLIWLVLSVVVREGCFMCLFLEFGGIFKVFCCEFVGIFLLVIFVGVVFGWIRFLFMMEFSFYGLKYRLLKNELDNLFFFSSVFWFFLVVEKRFLLFVWYKE